MELCCYRADATEVPSPAAEARDRLTFKIWGPPLTLEQYLLREQRLWRHAFSRTGLRRWVLSDGGEPVASCETYRVPVVLTGTRERVGHGAGVASVFVEEHLRGRGYARALLTRVHAVLRDEGALCAYLISEIDPAFYARLGYVARPLRLRHFSAPRPGEPEPELDQLRWLQPRDLAPLLQRRYGRPLRSPLTLLLEEKQLDWHQERARFYAEVLGRSLPPCVGAECGPAFAIWARDFRHNVLRVLCLYPGPGLFAAGTQLDPRNPEVAALRNVLHGARAEAAHAGLGGIEVWENALTGWLRGGQSMAAAAIPMLAPLAGGVQADDWLDWERGHWL